jgi:hypothetical protein
MLGQAVDSCAEGTNDPRRGRRIVGRDRQPDIFQVAIRRR